MDDILSPADDTLSFPGSNLLTIPGVGPKTLAAILSAVGSTGQAFLRRQTSHRPYRILPKNL